MNARPMVSKPLMALDHVGHSFDDGRIVALRDVNLTFGEGESVAILGPSGSGKTTLILVMCGMQNPHDRRAALERRAHHHIATSGAICAHRDRHRVSGAQSLSHAHSQRERGGGDVRIGPQQQRTPAPAEEALENRRSW